MKFQQILKLQPNWKHIGEGAAIANKIWITDQLRSQNKTSYRYHHHWASASPNTLNIAYQTLSIFTSASSAVCVCLCVLYESAFACLTRGGARPCPAPLCIDLITHRNVNQTHHSIYIRVRNHYTADCHIRRQRGAETRSRPRQAGCVCVRLPIQTDPARLYCGGLWLCLFVLQEEHDHLWFLTLSPGAQKKVKHMVLHTCTHIPTCKLHNTWHS